MLKIRKHILVLPVKLPQEFKWDSVNKLPELRVNYSVEQECTSFRKIQAPPQNSRCQKGDIKQGPY
jgi:hypothetical protein